MGRELKRVALDFVWPIDKTWEGYVNPHYTAMKCHKCDETGSSLEANRLQDLWYGHAPFRPEDRGSVPFLPTDAPIMAFATRNVNHSPEFYGSGERVIRKEAERLCSLFNSQWRHHLNQDDVNALIKSERLHELTHTWEKGSGWKPKEPPYVPTPREVNEWGLSGFGPDQWHCVKAECERLGYPILCSNCHGEGAIWPSEEDKARYENWQKIDPPEGQGYQVWETVSEGSPISPVFSTPHDLASHMATTKWGADKGTSYETWLKFINGYGYAPSLIVANGVVMDGVDGIVNG